ncbi:MAG: DUF4395 domain-containing protein [Microbacterium sp.]
MSSSPEPRPRGIDPRGPRFAAWITTALLAVAVFVSLLGAPVRGGTTVAERVADPAFWLFVVIAALFVWGFSAPRTAPWGVLYRTLVQPRLAPPTDLEDPRPPRFAQVVGFIVIAVGLVLYLVGVPWALPIAGAAAFVAAFLNAAFAFCLGCQIYLGLARVGVIRPRGGLVGA